MPDADPPPALAVGPHLQTRLGTLVLIRWLAIAGQLATIIVVQATIGGLDLVPVLAAVGALAVLNGALTVGRGVAWRIDERAAAWHLAFDIAQLAALVGFTGGLTNPFALFLLAPVAVAAATLSGRLTAVLTAQGIAAVTVITVFHTPLPWPDGDLGMPMLYLVGAWLALVLGMLCVAFFTWRMAEEARQVAGAYSASRMALAQEQRRAEVGALAAAVAHELNTPLATLHLVTCELADELPRESPLQSLVATLIGQTERCRDSLARLTRRSDRDAVVGGEKVAFPALVEMAAQPHAEGAKVELAFHHHAAPGAEDAAVPWLEHSPEILHGIGNFIQNALQFARTRVAVETSWGDGSLSVRIADDGPGFSQGVLGRLGEPYLSTRDGDGSHLGLGVFIAATLLERTGARVAFCNRANEGGAEVMVVWRNGGVG